jgi:hypothetical protein
MVAKLVRIRHGNAALTRGVLPHDVPSARPAVPEEKPARTRHSARHARTPGAGPPQRTSLSIRSAERRRWSADLTGPNVTALVVHGVGLGKERLAFRHLGPLTREIDSPMA